MRRVALSLTSLSLAFSLTLSALPANTALAIVPAQITPLTDSALANALYPVPDVPGGEVRLVNGQYANTDDSVTVQLLGRPRATGDVDGDGNREWVVYLVANTGGTGVYSYISVVANDNGTAKPLDTVFLGDRVDVRAVAVVNGEVRVALRERRVTQPMSARPTVRLTYGYTWVGGKLVASQPLSSDIINNAEYPLDIAADGDAQFTNGQYVDKANRITASILPRPRVNGDLNGDGSPDTVVTLVGNSGGSGVFTYIGALINGNYGPSTIATAFIADRIALSGISIQDGQISVTYLERKPDEPMVARATVPTTVTFTLDGNKLITPGGTSPTGQSPATEDEAPATTPEPPTSSVPAPQITVSYTCADDKAFTVVFNGAKASLTLDGVVEALEQQESGSGIRYGNDKLVLVGKGNDALIEDPTGNIIARECTATGGDTAGTESTVATPAPTIATSPVSYTCTDGKAFEIVFEGGNATVTLDGKTEALTQQESGSGVRYGNDNIVFLGKGDDAIIENPTGKLLASDCAVSTTPAATPAAEAPAGPIPVSFTCADGQMFDVVYEGEKATVTISGTTEVLDQKLSGSGFRYGNDKITLAGKGNEAVIVDAQDNTIAGDCTVSPMAGTTPAATPAPSADTTSAGPIQASYTCANDQTYDITYEDGKATVTISDTVEVLEQKLSGSGFRYANDKFTLAGKGNEIVIVDAQDNPIASDCKVTDTPSSGRETAVPTTTVTSTTGLQGDWTATQLGEESLAGVKMTKPVTLKFAENRVSGNAGCNGLGGSYKTDGNTLTFGPIISTLMACPEPGVMERERTLGQALQETQSYAISGTTLSLLNSAGAVLGVFERAPAAASAESMAPKTDVSLSGILTGVVLYRQRIALPDNAVIVVKLQDTSKADAPATDIATATIETQGSQVPIPFDLTYAPAQIDARMRYTLSVRITVDGRLLWINTTSTPVLTRNAPKTDVTVMVNPA